jgi:chromosome segregation ATPase
MNTPIPPPETPKKHTDDKPSNQLSLEAQLAQAKQEIANLTKRIKDMELGDNLIMEIARKTADEHKAEIAELRAKLERTENDRHHCREITKDTVQQIRELHRTKERLTAGIKAVATLIFESTGVAGLHLNDEIAPWTDLQTGGKYQEYLKDFDDALAATKEQ